MNDILVERIHIQNMGHAQGDDVGTPNVEGYFKYVVNGVYTVIHARRHGHRELARLALNALRKGKR